MPGPGTTKKPLKYKVTTCNTAPAETIPVLASASEIGKFCSPATPSAFATVHSDLLRGLLLDILDKGRKEGYEKGKGHGYDEGYDAGLRDSPEDDFFEKLREEDEKKARVDAFEEGKEYGRKDQLEDRKMAEERAHENGWREGHETGLEEGKEEREVTCELAYQEGKINGRLEERESWTSNHGEGLCASLKESTSRILGDALVWNDATTQTDAPVPVDSHQAPILTDNGTVFFQLPTTKSTSTQADEPPPIPATLTPPASSTTPANTATSLLTAPAQSPSTTTTSLTTTTTTALPASKPPPAPRECRRWIPGQSTAPQLSPQPLVSSPEPRRPAATSLTTLAATPATNTRGTTSRDS